MRVRLASGAVVRVVEGGCDACAGCSHPIRPKQRRTVDAAGEYRVARHAVTQCQPDPEGPA